MNKRFISALTATLLILLAVICSPSCVNPALVSVSAVSEKLSAPKSIKTKSTEYSITLSWSKVSGAYKYRVYDLNQNSGKYEKWEDTKDNKLEIYVFPGREYKFRIAAIKKNGSKLEIGEKSKVITVTSKTHFKYNFPVFTDYGFDRLEPQNAYDLYCASPGTFGAYKDYDNTDSNQTTKIAESFIEYVEDVEALGLTISDFKEDEYELKGGSYKIFSYSVYDGKKKVATINLIINPNNWVLVDLIPVDYREYPDSTKDICG